MMYKDRSNYTKEQWDLKRKYDKAFDNVFFERGFPYACHLYSEAVSQRTGS